MAYAELETIYQAALDMAEESDGGGRYATPGSDDRWKKAYDRMISALADIASENDGEMPMFIDDLIGDHLREH